MEKQFQNPINISFDIKYYDNEIIEAFGISEDKKIKIIDNFQPKLLQNENLFITGDSGSGKSQLLKLFGKQIDIDEIPKEPLLDWIDKFKLEKEYFTLLLSGIGLCDVFLFTRDISTFSDSQKYRTYLLYCLLQNTSIIILDEFLSTLDRNTAKPIAFAFQKLCKKINKRFIIASAHDDIIEYLKPDKIWKGEVFTGKWIEEEIKYNQEYPISLEINELEVKGIKNHFLLKFHYQENLPGNLLSVFNLILNEKEIGLIIIGKDLFNRKPIYIRRLIIHPNYRGCGFSKILINYCKEKYKEEDLRILSKILSIIPFSKDGQEYDYKRNIPIKIYNYFEKLEFNWNNMNDCKKIMNEEKHRNFLLKFNIDYSIKILIIGSRKMDNKDFKNLVKNDIDILGKYLYYIRPRIIKGFRL